MSQKILPQNKKLTKSRKQRKINGKIVYSNVDDINTIDYTGVFEDFEYKYKENFSLLRLSPGNKRLLDNKSYPVNGNTIDYTGGFWANFSKYKGIFFKNLDEVQQNSNW